VRTQDEEPPKRRRRVRDFFVNAAGDFASEAVVSGILRLLSIPRRALGHVVLRLIYGL
jgi:hypothetical protein